MKKRIDHILVAPSVLSSDFANLEKGLEEIAASGADWIHLDVMDGHFVPNLTFGPPVIKAMRSRSKLPFDVHLMIDSPERWLSAYREAGADRITFHLEACHHSQRYLVQVKELGAASGIALNPQTSISGLEYLLPVCDQVLIMTVNPGFGGQEMIESVVGKIAELRHLIEKLKAKTIIEVDGGIDRKTAEKVIKAGANVLVMGSAFFKEKNRKDLVRKVKQIQH